MKRPTNSTKVVTKPNGCLKNIPVYSYVAVLCEKDGDRCMAVRFDGYERGSDLWPILGEEYPDWKLKAIHKLYDEDFEK